MCYEHKLSIIIRIVGHMSVSSTVTKVDTVQLYLAIDKVKVKLSLCLTRYHAMKMYPVLN
jgi:hypothetical protein